MAEKRNIRQLITGVSFSLILLATLFLGVLPFTVELANAAGTPWVPPSGQRIFDTSGPNYTGSKLAPCDCPAITLPTYADITDDKGRKNKWRKLKTEWNTLPTRCIKENKDNYDNCAVRGNLNNNFRPYNDLGDQYPEGKYPAGFWDTTKRGNAVPFPGWPKIRYALTSDNPDSSWSTSKARDYRKWYVTNGGVVPVDTCVVGSSGNGRPSASQCADGQYWRYYQIHHIMERCYGGMDTRENLVPLDTTPSGKSLPSGSTTPTSAPTQVSIHQKYTDWWSHITVDDDRRP